MIQTKGVVIKSRLEFAQAVGGEWLMQKLRESPPPVGGIAAAPMVSFRVFPLSDDDVLCRTIAKLRGQEPGIYERIGAYYADTNRGVQNAVLGSITDPKLLFARFPKLLLNSLAGDPGTVKHEFPGANQARLVWDNHRGGYESHCLASIGYFARVLENAGVLGVTGRNDECIENGARLCIWDFSWVQATGERRSTKSIKAIRLKL